MHRIRRGLAVCASALVLACAGVPINVPEHHPGWAYFEAPPGDVWSEKISEWQMRQQRDRPLLAARDEQTPERRSPHALLRENILAIERDERRQLARRITQHAQVLARHHYRWDPETSLADDPWPTSLELYEKNGDDCDGLDLIAFDLLEAFAFPEDQLYRVVVRRDRDGAHHMATLWFEDRDDPWVIDVTAAITRPMRRLSELRGWTPLRVFDENELYGVRVRGAGVP